MQSVGVKFEDLAKMFEICAEECRTMVVLSYSDILFNVQDERRYNFKRFLLNLKRDAESETMDVLHECGFVTDVDLDENQDIDDHIEDTESYLLVEEATSDEPLNTYYIFNCVDIGMFITRLAIKAASNATVQKAIVHAGLKNRVVAA